MAEHGTRARYRHGKCHCIPCKAANTRYMNELKLKLAKTPFDEIPHGTTNAYNNYNCRCIPCKAAKAVANGTGMKDW